MRITFEDNNIDFPFYLSDNFDNIPKQKFDLINGQREINSKNTSRLKIVGKTIVNAIANFCFDDKIIDYNSGLRVFNKEKFVKHSHIRVCT